MPLVIRVIAIGDGKKVCLKQTQHLIKVVVNQRTIHSRRSCQSAACLSLHIVGEQTFHQADTNFPVGNVKGIELA